MIKKLRLRLVAASMLSLLLVLAVIEGMVGILNYRKIVRDADGILEVLEQNAGNFPRRFPGEKMDGGRFLSPELPYESRYFSVLFNEKGNIIFTDTGKVASIDTGKAVEYAQTIMEKGTQAGFMDDYRYCVSGNGTETRVIFLDCRRELDSFQNLIVTACMVTLAGFLAVLVLMIYVSARIVKPLSDNYEKQKRFITDAGHELKTPLTIINADAEVLEMDLGENEWLKDIQNQTRRMSDLTNALVALARMEEGQQTEMRIDFPLSDIAEETVSAFQAPALIQGKTLISSIAPMISMKGEEKAIRELLTILLDNALKYSDEGGRIEVTLEKQKNRIVLSVFNTAESVKKEHLAHLFDRFYRTDASRNSQTGGYGLGLSIAAATAASHRGKIKAETEDEKSLRITVTFPG